MSHPRSFRLPIRIVGAAFAPVIRRCLNAITTRLAIRPERRLWRVVFEEPATLRQFLTESRRESTGLIGSNRTHPNPSLTPDPRIFAEKISCRLPRAQA
jgi:hypothetical protein